MKKNEYRSDNAVSELKNTLIDNFKITEEIANSLVKTISEDNIDLMIHKYNFLFSDMNKELFDRQYNNIVKFLNKSYPEIEDIEQIIETSKITANIQPYYLDLKTYLPNDYCDNYIYDHYKKTSEAFAPKRINPDKLKLIINAEIDYLNSILKKEIKLCKTGK
jgi:hypothetical protein